MLRRLQVLSFAIALLACAQQSPDPSTLEGKVLLGYQGWFRCPGGGAMGTNWRHWAANGIPGPATLVVDMYPDLREFEAGELCAVPGMTIGANPAYLFSSGNSQTVERHFRWMQQYGLDGVLVQRFVTEIAASRASGDAVLRSVLAAARRYGRVFAIEYDVSGANPATVLATMQADWQYLVETLEVTAHPGYLRHGGKPVLGVWGIGLNDTRHPPSDPDAALRLIEWFRDTAGVTYIGGTPAYWRTLSNDAATDPRWAGVYQAMDGIQPWTVGRYNSTAAVDRWRTERLQPDITLTAERGQIYMPVVFPGFSWYNLNRTAPQNAIPRNKGEFLWRQAYNAKAAGAKMLKIAMFDEVDESTAMFKLASRRSDAPDQGFWLTLDADGFTLPSDWYLRLAGEITQAFHGGSMSASLPVNPGPPFAGSPVVTAANGASFDTEALAAGMIVTVQGEALMPNAVAQQTGLTVIDSTGWGRASEVLFASGTEWHVVLPAELAPGPATFAVEREDGSMAFGRVEIRSVAPGIFSAAGNGSGPAAAVIRIEWPDGTATSQPAALCLGVGLCVAAPVDLGPPGSTVTLELYGTGIRGRSTLDRVQCFVGEIESMVVYAGPQGPFRGLDQVNVILPRQLAGRGLVNVELVVDGARANPVQIAIH